SFVALSLTPMMGSKILKKREKQNWIYQKTEPLFVWMNEKYNDSLRSFMKMRWLSIIIVALSFGLIVLFSKVLQSELAPLEDRGQINVNATGPEGATFEYMAEYIDKLVAYTKEKLPTQAIISVTSPGWGSAGANSGFLRITLTDREDRDKSQQELFDDYVPELANFPAARAFASQQQTIGGRRAGLPVQYVIQTTSLDKLKEVLPVF